MHDLYELAGKPAARTISDWIRERDDLPGTLSHEGVSAVLRGAVMPRWANLESLVCVLVANRRIGESDIKCVVAHIHTLWRTADGSPVSQSVATPQAPDIAEQRAREDLGEVSGLHAENCTPEPESDPLPQQESFIRWEHPRLGTVEFRDRQTAVEILKEIGGFNDRP